MPIASPRLRRLDDALASLPPDCEAMLLSELDGYIAGIVLCPAPIAPDEWLPPIWHGADGDPPFEDEAEADWYAGLVLRHHDATARTLEQAASRYAPFLEIDPRNGDVLWELWIEGFAAAMALRPDAWPAIGDSGDAGAAAALAGMTTLAAIAADTSDLERAAIDALTDEAPDLIPRWVRTLHAWRRARTASPVPAPAPVKVGRNEPCPCGSGRKHKRCCGSK